MSSLTASAQTNNTFFLGHSLINFNVPNMVDKLSIASGENFSYDANIGNGATLSWHWNSPTSGQGDQWDLTLPNGGYENFIFTEAVPLQNHLTFSNTYRYTDSLCSFATQYSPNVQHYLYETWHCIYSGNGSTTGAGGFPCDDDPQSTTLWRERLDIDLAKWESIADSMDLIYPNPMYIIPGGQALAKLSDSIDAGAVPGLTSIFELFTDNHHLDNRGNYFIGCLMYAVLHGQSPVGLPNQLTSQFDVLYTEYPTPAQAAIFQEIAWQTICEYPRDGVDCSISGIAKKDFDYSTINVYPVPAKNDLTIQYNQFSNPIPFTINDRLGRIVESGLLTSKATKIDVSQLSEGLYFINIENQTVKFMK